MLKRKKKSNENVNVLRFCGREYTNVTQSYGRGSGDVFLGDVKCTGTELNLEDCLWNGKGSQNKGIGQHKCTHDRDVGLQCGGDLQVRLVDGPRKSVGRVEVYYNGRWGTVCYRGFSVRNARVVCRALGYTGEKAEVIPRFGGGSGDIFLRELSCTGNEALLRDCAWKGKTAKDGASIFSDTCIHSYDVGVDCGENFDDVRLIGSSRWDGRVEVFINGKWGTLCPKGFGYTEGRVICTWLGYKGSYQTDVTWYSQRRKGSGDVFLEDLKCSGAESSIGHCSWSGKHNNGTDKHNCTRDSDLGLHCLGDFQVRLADGPSEWVGRLEVYFNGRWGTVCHEEDNAGKANAQVVCKALGYTGEKAEVIPRYGGGSGDVFLRGLNCSGSETRLRDCSWKGKGGVSDGIGQLGTPPVFCNHTFDVGVDCGDGATIRKTTTRRTTTTPRTTTRQTTTTPKTKDASLKIARELIWEVDDALNQGVFQTNQTVVGDIVRDVSQLMDADNDVLNNDSINYRLLEAIGRLSREGELSDGQLLITSSNLAIAARAVDSRNFSGLTLTADAGDDYRFHKGEVQIYPHSLVQETTDSISSLVLPASLLTSVGNASRIAMEVHIDGRIFETIVFLQAANKSNTTEDDKYVRVVNSHVMSASVNGFKQITNLKDPVKIHFVHLNKDPANRHPECVFWDQSLDEGRGNFSSAGCYIVHEGTTSTTCECDHLTNFALLMDVYRREDNLPPEHGQILSVISYVGCGVSLVALLLTILTYCLCNPLASRAAGNVSSSGSCGYCRIPQLKKPSKILVSLCVALALSNLVFVAGMQDYTLRSTAACKVVAMLLHFSLLSAMCWMCVEAFYMYLAFVRVFRTTITHFFLKASCFGWGIPLVIVAVTAGVNTTDNYAPLGNGLCWLKGVTFYIAFVAPVCLVLLCNVISFVLVLRVILGLTNNKPNSTQTNQAVQKLRRAVGVVILLGLTWVFGFLAIDDTSRVVFNYLFAIFNSLQGLFIYLFYGVFNKDARAACKLWFRCCESKPSAETAMPVEAKRGTSVKETKDKTPPLKSSTAETFLTSGASACASSTGDEITSV